MATLSLSSGVSQSAVIGKDPVLFSFTGSNGFSFYTSVLEEGIHASKGANYQQLQILARSSPVLAYSDSSPMTLSVKVSLFALRDAASEVVNVLDSLYSLVFPMDPGVIGPPTITVNCPGFKMFSNWPCVLERVDSDWSSHKTWSMGGLPMSANASLNFLGYEVNNISSSQWMSAQRLIQLSF